jgi:spermidine synthase
LVKPGKLKQKKNNKSSSKHNHDDAHDTNDEMVPYHGHVAFEFHLTMACSIGLLNDSCCPPRNPSPAASTPAPPSLRVLIVGLGGGCLPMFIHEHFNHVELTCVEIDAEMESIATNWFGYASNSARMTTVLGDGVAYIQNWKENKDPKHRQEKFHVVIFDVDAKDALKTGVSFPPKEFLTPSFIQHVESKILMEDGMLCINVASRSNKMFAKTINTMKNIFNVVDVVQYEESLNRIVFAYKSTALDDRAFSSSGGLEPLEAGAVLRRLKKRATKEWPAETDEDIMDAMEDVKSY